jgi:hypothetical protein
MAEHRTATPEKVLRELRERQERDRKKRREALSRARRIERAISQRAKAIAEWASRARAVRRLANHNVSAAWTVLMIADQSARAQELGVQRFREVWVAVMWRETGLPQRNVFGCDWGSQGGDPPYCGEGCTEARVRAWWPIHREKMNGTSWAQLTWFEKVERAQALGGCWKPENSMKVGAHDLALLIAARGWHDGIKGYNGDGPAAEEYADDVLDNKAPVVHRWLT